MILRGPGVQHWFNALFLLSLVIAAFAVWRMMSSGNGSLSQWFEIASVWLGVFAAGLVLFGRRTFWFLVGAPFALGPAALFTVYLSICAAQHCS